MSVYICVCVCVCVKNPRCAVFFLPCFAVQFMPIQSPWLRTINPASSITNVLQMTCFRGAINAHDGHCLKWRKQGPGSDQTNRVIASNLGATPREIGDVAGLKRPLHFLACPTETPPFTPARLRTFKILPPTPCISGL